MKRVGVFVAAFAGTLLTIASAHSTAALPPSLKSALVEAELLPLEQGFASESEGLGSAVSLVGDIALVGAPGSADQGFISNGDVLVFLRDSVSGTWEIEAQLLPVEIEEIGFGASLAFDGTRAVVGAPGFDVGFNGDAGAAFVFERDAGGNWTQVATLVASDPDFGAGFGRAVGIDGGSLVVGAPLDDGFASKAGAAYVFERQPDNSWMEVEKLVSTAAASQDQAGTAVAISGDVVIVGAPLHTNETAPMTTVDSGAVHIYRNDGNSWIEEATVFPAASADGDQFGDSVAMVGNRLVAGAPSAGSGTAVVFEFDTIWQEIATLSDPVPDGSDDFGDSVALGSDLAVVGAPWADAVGSNSGEFHVFRRAGDGSWNHESALLPGDLEVSDFAGSAVAVDGDFALLGLSGDDDMGSNAGAASVFQFESAAWAEQQKLIAGSGSAFDNFGLAVAFDDDLALVGAPGDDAATDGAGAAYLFRESAGSWTFEAQLLAPDADPGHGFGGTVALKAGRALVGAPDAAPGHVHVFESNAGSWDQTARLDPSVAEINDFGYALALDGDRLAVGGNRFDSSAFDNFGTVTIFDFDSMNGWQEAAVIEPDSPVDNARFGDAVALAGDRLLVGAYREGSMAGPNAGSAYIFDRAGDGSWPQSAKLDASDGGFFHEFGTAVALDGDRAIIGAPGADQNENGSGAVYVFDFDASWSETTTLLSQDPGIGQALGTSLALAGDLMVAGAPSFDNGDGPTGSVVAFRRDAGGTWLEALRVTPDSGMPDDDFGIHIALSQERVLVGASGSDRVGSNAGLAAIAVLSTNSPPAARDDPLATDEDTALIFDLFADNGAGVDGDADGEAIVVTTIRVDGQDFVVGPGGTSAGDTAGGIVTVNPDGSGNYDPNQAFESLAPYRTDTVSFDYTIADPGGATSSATVTITISGLDDVPTPVDDDREITEDGEPLLIDVLANDPDPDGGDPKIISLTQPAFGSVRLVQFGRAVEYTPTLNHCTEASVPVGFDYELEDGSLGTVTVDILCVDDLPVAVDDAFIVDEDQGATLEVLANDVDVDAGPILIESFIAPARGDLILAGDAGAFSYTPAPDDCTDGDSALAFEYTLNGGASAAATITISCVDDPGTAVADNFQSLEDTITELNVLANDQDVDGRLNIASYTEPAEGFLTVENESFLYEPPVDFCGMTSWHYTLSGGSSATVALEVVCVNDPPTITVDDVFAPTGFPGLLESQVLDQLVMGGPDESSQLLVDQFARIVFDFDDVLASASLSDGTLQLTLTGNDGVADVGLWLQDNGGTDNGGIGTSETVVRVFASSEVVPDLSVTATPVPVVFPGNPLTYEVMVANEGLAPALAEISMTLDAQLLDADQTCTTSAGQDCPNAGSQWVLIIQPAQFVTLSGQGSLSPTPAGGDLESQVDVVELGGTETDLDNNQAIIVTDIGIFAGGFEE